MFLKGQKTNVTCGPACLRIVLDKLGETISEKQAVDFLGTTKHGTYTDSLIRVLKDKNISCPLVELNVTWSEYEKWLSLNSKNRILILSIAFIPDPKKKKRGRPPTNFQRHFICVHNDYVFDPSDDVVSPVEEYITNYEEILIEEMILIDCDYPFDK